MSDDTVYQSRDSHATDPLSSQTLPTSPIEAADLNLHHHHQHHSEPSRVKDKTCATTICVHTTPELTDKVCDIASNYQENSVSVYTSSESGLNDDHPLFTQHITILFQDADQLDQCFLLLKKQLPETHFNMEISYDSLSHPGNLYVRWTDPDTTQDQLREIFSEFGDLTTSKIVFDEDNVSKGYGFFNFVLKSSADNAIKKLNDNEIDGNKFYINHHISKKERLSKLEMERIFYTNLYVKNIPEDYSPAELEALFSQYGPIESISIPTFDENDDPAKLGKLKGFGFVNYSNHDDALDAQQSLNNYEIAPGYQIQVKKAQKRDKGESTPSNISILSDMEPFTRDFNRLQMYVPQPGSSPSAYYNTTGSAMAQGQYYYPPLPPPPPPALYTPQISKNGLPIAGPNFQDSNLYIKNLPLDVGDDDLTQLFESFGEIVSAKVITSDGEHSKGYGFVCFKSPQHASRALVEMSNFPIDENHTLHVSFAQRKDNRVGANGVIHHYNQNHINYGGSPPMSGEMPQLSMISLDQSNLQLYQSAIYPYYYYPQGPNNPAAYGQLSPLTANLIAIPPPSMLQASQQPPMLSKGGSRQYYLQNYYSPKTQQLLQLQSQPVKSPMMIPGYGVDMYGRVVTNGMPRYPQQQSMHQSQQKYHSHSSS